MNCSDFKKEMNNFISGTMDVDIAKDFIKHFNECSLCNEELEIYYMINMTFNDNEANSDPTGLSKSFDFKKRLRHKIASYEENIYNKYKRNFITNFLLASTEFVAIAMMVYFIIFVLGGNNGW